MPAYTNQLLVMGANGITTLLAAADTISTGAGWTMTGAVAQTGATTFSTGTGAVSLNGDVTVASGKNLLLQGGSTFTTGTGSISLNGATTLVENFSQTGNKTFSTGTGAVSLNGATTLVENFSQTGNKTFSTGTGAVSLNGNVTVASGSTLTVAGTGATALGGTLAVTGNTTLSGTLTVTGAAVFNGGTVSVSTENVLIADNFLFQNSGWTTNSAQAAGTVYNYLPTTVTSAVQSGGFAAGAGPGPGTITVLAAAGMPGGVGFTAGDLVMVTGAANALNNGIFEVGSHIGTTLTIKGTGGTAPDASVAQFVLQDIVTDTTVAGSVTKINVAVFRTNTTGDFQSAKGSSTPLTFTSFALSTSSTLQGVYDNGTGGDGFAGKITTNSTDGRVEIAGTEKFMVTAAGGFDLDTLFDFDGSTFDVDATGAVTIDASGSNAIQIGSVGNTGAIDIGTGAGARAITLGNATGATGVTINVGTGALNLGNNAVDHAIGIGSGTGGTAITMASGTSGTDLTSTGQTRISMPDNTNGAFLLKEAGNIYVGVSTQNTTEQVNINPGDIDIAVNIQSGTKAINIGSTGQNRIVNVGTGAAVQTVTLGSSNGASVTNINAGTGHLTVQAVGTGAQMRFGMAANTNGGFSIAQGGGNNYLNIDANTNGTEKIDIGLTSSGQPAINIRGGNISITQAAVAAATPGYLVDFTGGAGGAASAGANAGNAGNFNITSGAGGAGLAGATPRNAGFAGNLNIVGGVGGAGSSNGTAAQMAHGVNGGNITIKGGSGGAGTAGANPANGGPGGSLLLSGGAGGNGADGTGGNSNGVSIEGGPGGAGVAGAGNPGNITIGNLNTLAVNIATQNNRAITIGHSGNNQAASFKSGAGVTVEATNSNLTLQTVTSGILAVTSAGQMNITAGTNLQISQPTPGGTGGLQGGQMTWTGAGGGLGSTTGPVPAGNGGVWNITSGAGGNATAGAAANSNAGSGASITLSGGAGGAGAATAGAGAVNGGAGANVTITSGAGGQGAAGATGGTGGTTLVKGGAAGGPNGGTQGVGGNLVLEGGQGNAHGNIQIGLANTSGIQIGSDGSNHTITLGDLGAGTKDILLRGRGAASSFTVAATGAAHDLTLEVTGAQDASVIVKSAGTGGDAIYLSASAGTMLLDARNNAASAISVKNGATAMLDVDTTTGQLALNHAVFSNHIAGVGSGVGISLETGVSANQGDLLAINANGKVDKASANDSTTLLCRAVGSANVAQAGAGAVVQVASVPGCLVPVKFGTNPVNGDRGKIVYLSTTAGEATLTAPSGSGNTVFRLGILQSGGAAVCNVLWMPQFIANIP